MSNYYNLLALFSHEMKQKGLEALQSERGIGLGVGWIESGIV